MTGLQRLGLVARVTMETGVIIAFAVWGYHTGTGTAGRITLTVLAPLLAFGVWGTVDFHQLGRLAEPLRAIEELAISGLAALAWYAAGWHRAAWSLAVLSVAYHVFVDARGDRLLATNHRADP